MCKATIHYARQTTLVYVSQLYVMYCKCKLCQTNCICGLSWLCMLCRTDCTCGCKLTVYMTYNRLHLWLQNRQDMWVWARRRVSHSYAESPDSRGMTSSTFMASCCWRRLWLDWELLCGLLVAKSDFDWTETFWGSSLFSKSWASFPSPSSGMASGSPACPVNPVLLSSFSSKTDFRLGLAGEPGVGSLGVSGLWVREGKCRNWS